jgi:hypothetical protein
VPTLQLVKSRGKILNLRIDHLDLLDVGGYCLKVHGSSHAVGIDPCRRRPLLQPGVSTLLGMLPPNVELRVKSQVRNVVSYPVLVSSRYTEQSQRAVQISNPL